MKSRPRAASPSSRDPRRQEAARIASGAPGSISARRRRPLDPRRAKVRFICGMRGHGKSTMARALTKTAPRLLAFDPNEEHDCALLPYEEFREQLDGLDLSRHSTEREAGPLTRGEPRGGRYRSNGGGPFAL